MYCTVLYLEEHGLNGANMTGVLLEIPGLNQLEQLHGVAPRLKRVGAICSPAMAGFVAGGTLAANELGLKMVTGSVGSSREVADAFAGMSGRSTRSWCCQTPRS